MFRSTCACALIAAPGLLLSTPAIALARAPVAAPARPAVCDTLEHGLPRYGTLEEIPGLPASSGTFRAIAVQNRQLIANSVSYQTYSAEIERLMGLADASFRYDTPTLVVFGEYVGLQTAFIGSRGRHARAASTETGALATLYGAYARQMSVIQQCYPAITTTTALELALTDTMWRAFYESFSRVAREYRVYLVAATVTPEIQVSSSSRDIRLFGDPDLAGQSEVYLPVGSAVHNTAFLFDPEGRIVGVTRKVNLTPGEGAGSTALNLTPGTLEDVPVFETPMGRVGIAICLDAFFDSYIRRLDAQSASIVVQPSFNDYLWAWDGDGYWQPEDWQRATLGSIQWSYPNIRYNINTMVTGNFFDAPVDGQSAITRKASSPPDRRYIGLEGMDSYVGEFVALAPWVMDDPGLADPAMSLDARRNALEQRSLELAAGSGSAWENGYQEIVLSADLAIVP